VSLPAGFQPELYLAGMYDGKIIALGWHTGEQLEYVLEVDPATGNTTSVGTVGDMRWWHRQAVLVEADDAVYVAGTADGVSYKLYAFDLTTNTVVGQPGLARPETFFAGADSAGDLVGVAWDGSAWQVYCVDPGTAAMGDAVGEVSGLWAWNGEAVVDPTTDTLYVSGLTQDQTRTLYILDLATGTVTDEQLMPAGCGEFLNHFLHEPAGGGGAAAQSTGLQELIGETMDFATGAAVEPSVADQQSMTSPEATALPAVTVRDRAAASPPPAFWRATAQPIGRANPATGETDEELLDWIFREQSLTDAGPTMPFLSPGDAAPRSEVPISTVMSGTPSLALLSPDVLAQAVLEADASSLQLDGLFPSHGLPPTSPP
jgi:hypothetical protein